jgi:hypothetical protein
VVGGDPRDNEYQNPDEHGSLSGSLRMWQAVRADGQETVQQQLVFTLHCPSESRADRVARYLRRSLDCATVGVGRSPGADRDVWRVEGSTRFEVQSLRRLERLSTWLRRSASRHQVYLVDLALTEATA